MASTYYERGVVHALYTNLRSMVAGAVAAVLVAVICGWQTGDRGFFVFATLIACAMAGRLLAARYYFAPHRATDGDRPNFTLTVRRLAVVQGAVASLLLGGLAFYAIHFDGSTFAELATISISLANVVGVVGRSFGSSVLVRLQLAGLCLPITIGFLLHWSQVGGLGPLVLAILPLVLISATMEIAVGQRRTLDHALNERIRCEELAKRLSITLETTPNGLMMFDATGRLRFANEQACALLAITAADRAEAGSDGLHRHEIEARIDTRLHAPPLAACHGDVAMLVVAPTTEGRSVRRAEREFVSRDDPAETFRFVERTNADGETVVRIDDVTALNRANRRALQMARFDGLTGLVNRGWFFELAEARLARATPDTLALVAVIDLNGLKAINDTQGHIVGDAAIRMLAARLADAVADTIGAHGECARLGGDEFVVLATFEPDHENPSACAAPRERARLVEALEDAVSFELQTDQLRIDVRGSVGICTRLATSLQLDEFIERADYAQYVAKRSETTNLSPFEDEMEHRLERRRSLKRDLPQAIASGELSTVYQPIFEASGNRIVTFEALARWKHPRFGAVPPDEFIAVAEEIGAIGAITRFQLLAATLFCTSLPEPTRISVNASARDFSSGSIVPDMRDALDASGLDVSRLVIEITETSLLELGPKVFSTLEEVRALGARVALDDFGTGYSSLSYMQRLELDVVKLDRAFLETLHDGPRTGSVLKAIRQLAIGLDMAVVIEGVETEAQLRTLREELGFDLFQGYLFGRPLPGEDARELACRMARMPREADSAVPAAESALGLFKTA